MFSSRGIRSALGLKLRCNGDASGGFALLSTAPITADVVAKGLAGLKLRVRVALSTATDVYVACYDADASDDAGLVSAPPAILSTLHDGAGELADEHDINTAGTYVVTIDLSGSFETVRIAVWANADSLAAGDIAVVDVVGVE